MFSVRHSSWTCSSVGVIDAPRAFADFLEADFAECSVKSGLPGKPAIKDSLLQVEDIAPKPSRLLLCHGCVVICPCA